jgi:hypothetical protein
VEQTESRQHFVHRISFLAFTASQFFDFFFLSDSYQTPVPRSKDFGGGRIKSLDKLMHLVIHLRQDALRLERLQSFHSREQDSQEVVSLPIFSWACLEKPLRIFAFCRSSDQQSFRMSSTLNSGFILQALKDRGGKTWASLEHSPE